MPKNRIEARFGCVAVLPDKTGDGVSKVFSYSPQSLLTDLHHTDYKIYNSCVVRWLGQGVWKRCDRQTPNTDKGSGDSNSLLH